MHIVQPPVIRLVRADDGRTVRRSTHGIRLRRTAATGLAAVKLVAAERRDSIIPVNSRYYRTIPPFRIAVAGPCRKLELRIGRQILPPVALPIADSC